MSVGINEPLAIDRRPLVILAILTLAAIAALAVHVMPAETRCRIGIGASPSPEAFRVRHRETLQQFNEYFKDRDWFCEPVGQERRFEGVYKTVFEGGDELMIFAPGTMRFTGQKYGTSPTPGQALYYNGSLFDRMPPQDQAADIGGMLQTYHLKFSGWIHREHFVSNHGTDEVLDMIFVDHMESVRLFKAENCQRSQECRESAKRLGLVWYYL